MEALEWEVRSVACLLELGRLRLRKRVDALALAGRACNEHGHNAGKKTSVESSAPADGCDRRTQTLQLIEIKQIGPDERAEAAADVSQRRHIRPRQQQGDEGCGQGGNKHRQRNSDAGYRSGPADG